MPIILTRGSTDERRCLPPRLWFPLPNGSGVCAGDAMKVANLPVSSDAVLHCTVCGEDYSSERNDYAFRLSPDHVMRCHRRVLKLAYRKTVYVDVQTGKAI